MVREIPKTPEAEMGERSVSVTFSEKQAVALLEHLSTSVGFLTDKLASKESGPLEPEDLESLRDVKEIIQPLLPLVPEATHLEQIIDWAIQESESRAV